MKTAVLQDLARQTASLVAWLQAGETVILLQDGKPLGRIVPESITARRDLFARRFAPLQETPERDLTDVVSENRGEA